MPTFLFNNPRTDNRRMFNDEIDWLVQELERFSGRDLSDQALAREIDRWESARSVFRGLDAKRRSRPSMISTTRLHQAAMSYHQGAPNAAREVPEEASDRPRIYLIGSPISYESTPILSRIEEQLRIVGDFNCGISRFADLKVEEKSRRGIKQAYYGQTACIVKRPNTAFYDRIYREIKDRECVGVVAWTLDFCDAFEFELNRMERKIGLPMLRLKSDFSVQNLGQLKTRIGAFTEMLDHE
jgi:benzoyl-CoA reductase/2-hydroxyglutaryl-CoA dehydratase subunit BcrC/BadD/HgdB